MVAGIPYCRQTVETGALTRTFNTSTHYNLNDVVAIGVDASVDAVGAWVMAGGHQLPLLQKLSRTLIGKH